MGIFEIGSKIELFKKNYLAFKVNEKDVYIICQHYEDFFFLEIPADEGHNKMFEFAENHITKRETFIENLEEEMEKLKKENKEALAIAQKSVEMKEEFEKEIYGKFLSLLNTKKRKIAELKTRLQADKGATDNMPTVASSSKKLCPLPTTSTFNQSDDDYDADTDEDTDEEKERCEVKLRSKKSSPRKEFNRLLDESSPDLFNDSLEADLPKVDFSLQKRKFVENSIVHSKKNKELISKNDFEEQGNSVSPARTVSSIKHVVDDTVSNLSIFEELF